MGKLNLLIANASKTFIASEITLFQNAVQAAEDYITAQFTFDYDVDVMIATPSQRMSTIPEDGIGGRTYHSRLIVIVFDKQQAAITENFVFETLCHEMSHSLRWEKVPEYSHSLFSGMIFEGLATILEEKAMADTGRDHTQFFLQAMQATSQEMIEKILTQLVSELGSTQYDYEKIFFTGDGTLPRWSGYRLGYYFVKRYLEQTGQTINQATLASYNDFKKIVL